MLTTPSVSLMCGRPGRRGLLLGLLAGTAMLPLAALAQGTDQAASGPVTSPDYPGITCQVLQVPMRDGTLLSTVTYMPAGDGPFPVVMQRNPYQFGLGSFDCFQPGSLGTNLPVLAQNGYVAMDQAVRGTYRSQGSFRAMTQEAQDGYDAIEWAAAQPWSTGKVGTTSGSYLGLTQWQPAIHAPPHLAAIAPQITASDYHDNWTYVNGVFDLWFGLSWPAGVFVTDQITRAATALGYTPDQASQAVADWNNKVTQELTTQWVYQLPLVGFPQFEQFAPYYYDWLRHEYYDAYWARMDVEPRYENVLVPALNNTASYDIFQVGSVRNFQGMRARGGSEAARAGTKLVVGAYGHAGDSGHPTFGDDGGEGSLLSAATLLPFFDRYLKGVENGWESQPAVRIYVLVPPDSGDTGSGFWITGEDFPLPGTQPARYDLQSDGHANTRLGDGRLAAAGSDGYGRGAPSDSFTYDPANPVPTLGGNMCCNSVLLPNGAQEQSEVELRSDVLVYTSEPLAADQAVIGPVQARFWAVSSAPDTDFTVKLVDVHPDGRTHNVLDRIVRARLRRGSKLPPQLIQPGQPYEYTLELGITATMFRAGHRIRVEVSSSNFPHYARNLNTGDSNNGSAEIAVAQQTILHDHGHRSYIELPVAPGVQVPAQTASAGNP